MQDLSGDESAMDESGDDETGEQFLHGKSEVQPLESFQNVQNSLSSDSSVPGSQCREPCLSLRFLPYIIRLGVFPKVPKDLHNLCV